MDTRLRELLHDVAQEMPIDVEGARRGTLRRARTRRAVSAAGAGLVVVALVAVSISALRLAGEPTVPANTGPQPGPATFAGLWPETDAEALAETQAAVDEGHHPLRTTPEGTATLLATDLLGWQLEDVRTEATAEEADGSRVLLSNSGFSERVPPISVRLQQLGDTGPNGVWSVVGVSGLIELVDVDQVEPGVIALAGHVDDLFEGAPVLEARVFDDASTSSLASARFELTQPEFRFELRLGPAPDGRASLLLTIPDATGASLGAFMTAVETPVGTPEPAGPNVTGVHPDVAATAQRIYYAAKARDIDALAELVDPNIFIHELGDASDPIPSWRADPSVLDLMVTILEMPPTTREIEGVGTFTFWPYLVNSDFTYLSAQERADLATLGYTDEDIRMIADSGLGYQGPRLAIDEQGVWRNFLTTGE